MEIMIAIMVLTLGMIYWDYHIKKVYKHSTKQRTDWLKRKKHSSYMILGTVLIMTSVMGYGVFVAYVAVPRIVEYFKESELISQAISYLGPISLGMFSIMLILLVVSAIQYVFETHEDNYMQVK